MSLFSPGGPDRSRPADKPVTKLTVRLPAALPEARVVALHSVYGEAVREGTSVLTLRAGDNRHVIKAPRAGRLLPLAGPGDELRAGDALFALHFEPGEALAAASGETEATLPDTARRSAAAVPTRRQGRGRHVPVLDQSELGAPAAPPRPGPPEPQEPEAEEARPGVAGTALRIFLALLLFLGGVVFGLPLLTEAGFGASVQARLAVVVAALALGLLLWRLLAAGAGRIAQLAIGLIGGAWVGLVLLGLSGIGPLPQGPLALPDSHALAPANRVRVPPARPSMVLPGTIAVGGWAGEPPSSPPPLAAPEQTIRDTAWSSEAFALTPAPPEVPPVRAGGRAEALPAPADAAAPAAGGAAAPVEAARIAARQPMPPGAPAASPQIAAAPALPEHRALAPAVPEPAAGETAPAGPPADAPPHPPEATPVADAPAAPAPAAAAPQRPPLPDTGSSPAAPAEVAEAGSFTPAAAPSTVQQALPLSALDLPPQPQPEPLIAR